jgi:hypothetical protein
MASKLVAVAARALSSGRGRGGGSAPAGTGSGAQHHEGGGRWPFQVNFHVLPFKNLQNTSRFVTLFSAHGDVVVGFAIFHIVSFQKEKKRKKRHSSMVCESKKVGRSAKLYKRAQKCQSLSQKLAYVLYGR